MQHLEKQLHSRLLTDVLLCQILQCRSGLEGVLDAEDGVHFTSLQGQAEKQGRLKDVYIHTVAHQEWFCTSSTFADIL